MPLTPFQAGVAKLLAAQRSPDSYLAGGAAIHIEPNTTRYSNDLDYFQDSVERVASAFGADRAVLDAHGYSVAVQIQQPGFIRGLVSKENDSTKVEWAHDSAWRFMPPIKHDVAGYVLHPVDLALNKLLALVGRDEPRDFLDILLLDEKVLSLGAMCWAAAGKDPGFTPTSLLGMLRRRGKYRPEDFARLHLTEAPDLVAMKQRWLTLLTRAESFIQSRPPQEMGCLYYSPKLQRFVSDPSTTSDAVPHYGRPGGVLPEIKT